jgi:dUTP pyrophosphatase
MIEIKLLDPRVKEVPRYATQDSAGLDLIACIDNTISIPPLKTSMIKTGIAINMQKVPAHLAAFIYPRSGKGAKEGKVLGNLTGVIDQDYQGELMVCIWNRNEDLYIDITPGEAIAQLVFTPIFRAEFGLVEEFSSVTERGEGGFGSTDNVK